MASRQVSNVVDHHMVKKTRPAPPAPQQQRSIDPAGARGSKGKVTAGQRRCSTTSGSTTSGTAAMAALPAAARGSRVQECISAPLTVDISPSGLGSNGGGDDNGDDGCPFSPTPDMEAPPVKRPVATGGANGANINGASGPTAPQFPPEPIVAAVALKAGASEVSGWETGSAARGDTLLSDGFGDDGGGGGGSASNGDDNDAALRVQAAAAGAAYGNGAFGAGSAAGTGAASPEGLPRAGASRASRRSQLDTAHVSGERLASALAGEPKRRKASAQLELLLRPQRTCVWSLALPLLVISG